MRRLEQTDILLGKAEQVSSHSRGHDPKGLPMRCKVQTPCVWHAVVAWQLLYHALMLQANSPPSQLCFVLLTAVAGFVCIKCRHLASYNCWLVTFFLTCEILESLEWLLRLYAGPCPSQIASYRSM